MSVNEITLHVAAAMEKITLSSVFIYQIKIPTPSPYTSKVLFMTIIAHGKWIKIEVEKKKVF